MNFVIFDLEWNRIPTSIKARCPDEIVQIGAVKYNNKMKCIGTFNRFIKPVLYTKMEPIIRRITGLDISFLMDEGVSFSKAMKDFQKFLGDDCVVMSWGVQDAKILRSNCQYFMSNVDLSLLKKFVDVQRYVTHLLSDSFDGGKLLGVKQAADLTNTSYDKKKLHDALVDASVSGKVFAKLYEPDKFKKYIVDVSTKYSAFRDVPITDINSKAVDKRIFKIRCPECGRYTRKKQSWHLMGNKFLSSHICRKCKKQYVCSIEILKSYGNIIRYKKRIKQITTQ